MPTPSYREPAAPPTKKPLAIQAAQVAFWAPIVSIILSLVINNALSGADNNSSVTYRQAFGWFYLALNAAALLAGVLALLGMRKHGKRNILMRSTLGMLFASVLLGSALYFAFNNPAQRVTQRLTGEWDSSATSGGKTVKSHLSLQSGGNASMRVTVDDASLTANGTWKIALDKSAPPLLMITWSPDTDSRLGQGLTWVVDQLDDTHMALHSILPENHVTFTRQSK